MKYIILAVMVILGTANSTLAQDTRDKATDIIRVCAPSENLRLKIDGQIGGLLAKNLAGVSGSVSGEVFQDAEILQKMIEASPSDTVMLYKMYLECIKPKLAGIPIPGDNSIGRMDNRRFDIEEFVDGAQIEEKNFRFSIGGNCSFYARSNPNNKGAFKIELKTSSGTVIQRYGSIFYQPVRVALGASDYILNVKYHPGSAAMYSIRLVSEC